MNAKKIATGMRHVWMLAATAGIGCAIFWLVRPHVPAVSEAAITPVSHTTPETVRVLSNGKILIEDHAAVRKHLTFLRVKPEYICFPRLTVSGSILARICAGNEPIEDRWQFSNGELANTYSDWVRTTGEVEFAQNQLAKTQELVKAETGYLAERAQRLQTLIKTGSTPERSVKAAKAELLKAQLQGEKDVFSAQSTLLVAMKTRAGLERDLSQSGIEAEVLGRAVEYMVLVVANVPEVMVSQVHEDQECAVRFFAYPDRSFEAHVESLSALLLGERRTMRVLFELSDPKELLRPGMFAEVGLGTNDRKTIIVPAEALLHVGLDDYVIANARDGDWTPVKVKVGEQHKGFF
ncbi:MAG TPA: efflux RND transporter periplasmic adaptor subunit, partial [Pirellulales bacterium]|nr:efflux RND transporter periplasmic adaptor subunit [Pirellulales bacterium]